MDLSYRTPIRTGVEVAESLRQQVQSGEISVGSRLPSQRAMADRLGVGRQAVAEAMSLLESEGFIVTRRGAHGGSYVCEPVATAPVWFELIRSSMADLEEALDFRMGIETQIARLAAERRTSEDLEVMRTAIDELPRTQVNRAAFREADGRFHAALSRAARNSRLEAALRRARADLFVPTDSVPYTETVEVTRRQHAAILRAVERHDAAAAARLVRAHIEETRRHLWALVNGEQLG
ncbi:MAG: FadR/GntR family transcriptional regulator [Candidatus Nanopelagicales bacterium]